MHEERAVLDERSCGRWHLTSHRYQTWYATRAQEFTSDRGGKRPAALQAIKGITSADQVDPCRKRLAKVASS